jgi:hypothetical protein
MNAHHVWVLPIAILVGCGDSESSAPSSSTDSAASDTSTSDTMTPDTRPPIDGGVPPVTDVSFDATSVGKGGPYFITGTITLPTGASAGRFVRIMVSRTSGSFGDQLGPAGSTKSGGTLTYKITGLQPGTYKIGVAIDETGNDMLNDPGDYVGYARGTVEAPKMSESAADNIAVSASVFGVDFGVGVL